MQLCGRSSVDAALWTQLCGCSSYLGMQLCGCCSAECGFGNAALWMQLCGCNVVPGKAGFDLSHNALLCPVGLCCFPRAPGKAGFDLSHNTVLCPVGVCCFPRARRRQKMKEPHQNNCPAKGLSAKRKSFVQEALCFARSFRNPPALCSPAFCPRSSKSSKRSF